LTLFEDRRNLIWYHSKGALSQQRTSHCDILQSIYFAN